MAVVDDAISLFGRRFGGASPAVISVPGRVNLIGEHIDYHNLPVLPMAIQRRVHVAFRPRDDRRIRAVSSAGFGEREFEWAPRLESSASGDWVNYVKAAAQAVSDHWPGLSRGIDAAVVSDLPAAAGLSSSSALLVGFTLALLAANDVRAGFDELMTVLPEGEYFVGTRGGGMDHAAVLAARAGSALLVEFAPIAVSHHPIPDDWAFLVAHSLTSAEKSGNLRAEYNVRRTAGTSALAKLGFASYAEALDYPGSLESLDPAERRSFLHVTSEALRVRRAVEALHRGDAGAFGKLLNESHASLRDQLRVSCPALDRLVEAALESGALGARLTGAGFGGCAVIFCGAAERERVAAGVVDRYYSGLREFDPNLHLMPAVASPGAMSANSIDG